MEGKGIVSRKINSSKQILLFYYAYGLMIIAASFFVNVNSQLFYSVKLLSVILFIMILYFKNWTKNSLLITCLIVIISLVVSYQSQSSTLPYLLLPVIASKDINFKQIVHIDLFFRSIGLLLTIILFLTGIIEENNLYRFEEGIVQIRHSLGYVHPNTLFMHVFIIAIDILVINYSKLKITTIVFLTLFLEFFSYITDSRTGMLVFYILLIFICIQKKSNILNKSLIVKFLITYCVPIFTAISCVLVWCYNQSYYYVYILDNILTGRIRSASYFMDTYGISIFGQTTERLGTIESLATGQRAFILDNFYFNLLISYGLVFTIVYIILYIVLIKKLFYQSNEIAILLIFVLFIYGFAEGIPLNIEYNYTVLLLSSIVFKENDQNKL